MVPLMPMQVLQYEHCMLKRDSFNCDECAEQGLPFLDSLILEGKIAD